MNDPSSINERITTLRSAIDGQLSDRGRVIDNLLDLRNEFTSPALIAVIDELLSDVPGLTVVENEWWSGALDMLSLAAEPTTI
ncbi:MAG: hypothetical protein HKN24_05190 [Acidimicrobiales bacterium]|nr:hypothetical protein [Acidimicrobiales bacterium]